MAKIQRTFYEWDCETWGPGKSGTFDDGTIEDHNHGESLAEVIGYAAYDPPNSRIVLVRDHEDDGRSWAYMMPGGIMPTHFRDACNFPVAKVPQRFHREADRERANLPADLGYVVEDTEPHPIVW